MAPVERVVEALASAGCGPRRCGKGWSARCPVHEDRKPSLSVDEGDDGRALVICRAGCATEAVVAAIGLTMADLSPDREGGDEGEWTPYGPAVAVYDYVDAEGRLLFQSCRTADKQFPCRRPDPTSKSGWRWKLGDIPRPLYRLPRVIEAVGRGDPIFVVEGEKDVHAVEAAGEVATCNPGGAGKWRQEHAEALAGADVVVVADRDPAGYDHARDVAASLEELAERVRVVQAVEGKDVSDHLAAGHTLEDLELVDLTEMRGGDGTTLEGVVSAGEQPSVVDDPLVDGVRESREPVRIGEAPAAPEEAASVDPGVVALLRERLGPATGERAMAEQAKRLEALWTEERLRRLARHMADEEEALRQDLGFGSMAAADFLAHKFSESPLVIEGFSEEGDNVLVAAQFKTGKTTLCINATRTLVQGTPFLGRFGVPRARRVYLLNLEMDDRRLQEWISDLGIHPEALSRLRVSTGMRGKPFRLTSPAAHAWLVDELRNHEAEVLLLDCLRPMVAACGMSENDNAEVSRLLLRLDEVKSKAGVAGLWLFHHAGRAMTEEGAEHARGASALDDWCDVRVMLVKDEHGRRYVRTEGRIEDVPEVALDFDPVGRILTVGGTGGRRMARAEALTEAVAGVVDSAPGINKTDLRAALGSGRGGNEEKDRAIFEALQHGRIHLHVGAKNARWHYPGRQHGDAVDPGCPWRPEG